MALAGIHGYLSLLLTLHFLHPQSAPQQVHFLEERPIPSFLKGLLPSVILPGLGYWSFPLTLTRQGTVLPRDALRHLLYTRHNPPYPHCGEAIQMCLGSLDKSLIQTLLFSFLSCWLKGIRSSKWPEGRLSFWFNGKFVLFPDRSNSPIWNQNV